MVFTKYEICLIKFSEKKKINKAQNEDKRSFIFMNGWGHVPNKHTEWITTKIVKYLIQQFTILTAKRFMYLKQSINRYILSWLISWHVSANLFRRIQEFSLNTIIQSATRSVCYIFSKYTSLNNVLTYL